MGTNLLSVDTFCLGEAFSSGQNSKKLTPVGGEKLAAIAELLVLL